MFWIRPLPAGTEVQYKVYACDRFGNWATSDIYGYRVVEAQTGEEGKVQWVIIGIIMGMAITGGVVIIILRHRY